MRRHYNYLDTGTYTTSDVYTEVILDKDNIDIEELHLRNISHKNHALIKITNEQGTELEEVDLGPDEEISGQFLIKSFKYKSETAGKSALIDYSFAGHKSYLQTG